MKDLFGFMILGSMGFLLYGIFSPQKALFWQKDTTKRTRTNSLKYYSASLMASFIGFGITPPKNEVQKDNNIKIEKIDVDNSKIDSSTYYLKMGDDFFTKEDYKSATTYYNKSLAIKENTQARTQLGIIHAKEKFLPKVQEHLEEAQKYSTDSMRIVLAKEYYMKGEKKLAVEEVKKLMEKGNKEAELLWNIYNPIRTRVTGYVTRCCDGSTSMATGRGACSHHGGVCNWNEPIVVQYREFE
jgi:tetratricopeptide (TPR) repeat protein